MDVEKHLKIIILELITALDGRSNRTKKLSELSGIENVGSIENIVKILI